jgi:hypothetical protein
MSASPNNAADETDARTNWKQSFVCSEAQLNQWQVMTHRFEVLNVAFVSELRQRPEAGLALPWRATCSIR